MARGLSQAMAANTSASESAGSQARISRARAVAPCAALRALRAGMAAAFSVDIAERRLDDSFLRHLLTLEGRDDAAVAEHVDAVAVVELVELGRVPEESAALGRLVAQQVVHLALGADVDAAHRIVHQDDARVGSERA